MCGIIGVVNINPLDAKFLMGPLVNLEDREYDSCGFFAKDLDGNWTWEVAVGRMKNLRKAKHLFVQGIAHLRSATRGSVCRENAHPQMSGDRIYVVHNGTVDNYLEIKASLVSKGYVFESDTDTEVIAHLINFYVSNLDVQYPTSTAVCMAMMDLRGKFSFIALDAETDTMVSVNNGLPLVVFQDDESTTIASDASAFAGKLGGQIYRSRDGDVLEMNGGSQKIRRVALDGGTRVQEKLTTEFEPYSPEAKM